VASTVAVDDLEAPLAAPLGAGAAPSEAGAELSEAGASEAGASEAAAEAEADRRRRPEDSFSEVISIRVSSWRWPLRRL
jgi:hypothetical protein